MDPSVTLPSEAQKTTRGKHGTLLSTNSTWASKKITLKVTLIKSNNRVKRSHNCSVRLRMYSLLKTFDPNITPGTNAAFSAGLAGISDVKLEDATTSSMVGETNDKVVNQLQVAKKTLELSEDLQKTIFEIVDLYLDPEVIFTMQKLKEIGKAMKGALQAAGIVNEVTCLNQLKQENDDIKKRAISANATASAEFSTS